MPTAPLGYCSVSDLLLRSDLQLPTGIDAQKYINDSADEIDSKIGVIYHTPVTIQTIDAEKYRTTILTLKRINAHLATGRIIMAISSPQENSELDAYGASLVKDALASIHLIAVRTTVLEGATANTNTPTEHAVSKSHIFNLDTTSSVEAFYDIVNPGRENAKVFSGRFIPGQLGG